MEPHGGGVYGVSLGIQVLSQKVRLDPPNLHLSVSVLTVREVRYDWIARVWVCLVNEVSERTVEQPFLPKNAPFLVSEEI